MIGDETAQTRFGCEHCWPATADAAWEASRALAHVVDLIEESHFLVRVLACGSCAQRFLSVFTEEIDWVDGEDPQYWRLLPITASEAAELLQQPGLTTETYLGPQRRCLYHDSPKGTAPRSFWRTGISIRWPDKRESGTGSKVMVDWAAFLGGDLYVHDLYNDAKFRYDKALGRAFVRFYGQKEDAIPDEEKYKDAIGAGKLITRDDYYRDG